MSFWNSELGEISGTAEHAFKTAYALIPRGTMHLARIDEFSKQQFASDVYYSITWTITSGEYMNRKVFQKVRVFDENPQRRHRALNMMKFIYMLFGIKPESNQEPGQHELNKFVSKHAVIMVDQWQLEVNGEKKEGNFVSAIYNKDEMRKIEKPAPGSSNKFTDTSKKVAPDFSTTSDLDDTDLPF